VAVEAALVMPIFVLLIFGTLEFGMFFKDWLAVSNSVRAGVRIASAEPRLATYAEHAAQNVAREAAALDMGHVEELWVYKAESDGTPVGGAGGFGACTVCVKYTWSPSASSFVQKPGASWYHLDQNACYGKGDSVGVYLRYEHPTVTKLFLDDVTIGDHAVMRLEPVPVLPGATTAKGCSK
jgi:hypothetical protein